MSLISHLSERLSASAREYERARKVILEEEERRRRATERSRVRIGPSEDDDDDDEYVLPRHRRSGRGLEADVTAPAPKPLNVEDALHAWHATRRSEYGMDTIDAGHECTWALCLASGSIVCIDSKLMLYGCVNSGIHHVCERDKGCTSRYTSDDGGAFCLYSKEYLETHINETMFDTWSRCRDYTSTRALRADALAEITAKARSQIEGSSSSLPPPEISWRDALTNSSADAIDGSGGGAMRYRMRLPEKERDMVLVDEAMDVSVRAITGDCGGTDARADGYLDINGTEEVDQAQSLEFYHHQAPRRRLEPLPPEQDPLPLRRSVKGSSSALSVPLLPMDRPYQPPPEYLSRTTRRDIQAIIHALFDVRYRRRVRASQLVLARTAEADAVRRYYEACWAEGVRPSVHVRDALLSAVVEDAPQLLTDVGLDKEQDRAYTNFVYELWRIAIHTTYFREARTKFRLLSHTLGALYMLRHPFVLAAPDGTVVASASDIGDAFLIHNLPPQGMLRDWDVPIHTQSPARIIAVTGVTRGRVTFSKTCISAGSNVIKAALLSLENDDVRGYVAGRLRDALECGIYEDDSYIFMTADNG